MCACIFLPSHICRERKAHMFTKLPSNSLFQILHCFTMMAKIFLYSSNLFLDKDTAEREKKPQIFFLSFFLISFSTNRIISFAG